MCLSGWGVGSPRSLSVSTVDRGGADYSRIFLTRAKTREVRQSVVTLQEVLEGISPDDRRLHDEILDLLRPSI